ncbi:MAG: hypothetical protein ACFFDQ_11960, partial [Candidatus Thorarchaeota archaeon]
SIYEQERIAIEILANRVDVEIDRALDPKSKIELNVKTPLPQYIPEPISETLPIKRETENLQAEIQTDILRPKRGFEIRFLVKERSRVKGVRLDILRREDVICKGTKLDSKIVINEKHVPITSNDFDHWLEETIHHDWSTVIPFESRLIKTSLVLKVVMEVGLSLDPFIEFPLRLSGEKPKEELTDDHTDFNLDW